MDRLLASPRYGEHWGRHWLDVARYADTGGDASDFPVPEMYRYRNYVIRSMQQDKPFDEFLREQLAGDLMTDKDDEDRAEKLAATGYIANSRRFGQTEDEFYLTIDDTIENLGKAVLGLSTGCARCHDHKFDPIPTKDYYALAGHLQEHEISLAGLEHHQYLDGFAALRARIRNASTSSRRAWSKRTNRQEGRRERRKSASRGTLEVSRSLGRSWPDPPKLARHSDDLCGPRQYAGECARDGEGRSEDTRSGSAARLSADSGREYVPADHKGSGRDCSRIGSRIRRIRSPRESW